MDTGSSSPLSLPPSSPGDAPITPQPSASSSGDYEEPDNLASSPGEYEEPDNSASSPGDYEEPDDPASSLSDYEEADEGYGKPKRGRPGKDKGQ